MVARCCCKCNWLLLPARNAQNRFIERLNKIFYLVANAAAYYHRWVMVCESVHTFSLRMLKIRMNSFPFLCLFHFDSPLCVCVCKSACALCNASNLCNVSDTMFSNGQLSWPADYMLPYGRWDFSNDQHSTAATHTHTVQATWHYKFIRKQALC